MAISTKAVKLKNVGQHPKDIGQSARSAISRLSVAVEDAKKFTAYMNSNISVLTVDSEDRLEYSTLFRDVIISLAPVLTSLAELQALDGQSLSKADFIASMIADGLDLLEYAEQFK